MLTSEQENDFKSLRGLGPDEVMSSTRAIIYVGLIATRSESYGEVLYFIVFLLFEIVIMTKNVPRCLMWTLEIMSLMV